MLNDYINVQIRKQVSLAIEIRNFFCLFSLL